MVVGEAPGAEEDARGIPFIGRSGKLLDKALDELAGIDRSEVYVTNVVKCRPPDNRTPERSEIKTCVATHLSAEIDALGPEWILTLGNVPLTALTGKSGITKHNGSTFKRDGATVFATLHPAAVMRNPHYAQAFAMDVARFGQMVAGTYVRDTTRVFLCTTKHHLHVLRGVLMRATELSVDIETYTRPAEAPYRRTNFQDFHGDDSMIVSVSFSWRPGVSVVVPIHHAATPWKNPDAVLRFLAPALVRPGVSIGGQNFKFDQRWLHSKGVYVEHDWDAMLSGHMIDENRSKGLKNRSRAELGVGAYDVGEDLKDAYNMDLHRLAIYNGKDTDYTLRLKRRDADAMEDDGRSLHVYRTLMIPGSNALVDVERNGIYIDPDRWQNRYDTAVGNRDKINDYIQRKFVPPEMRPINFRAPQQIGRLLFDHHGLPVLKMTKSGKGRSTDESVLLRLAAQGHKVALAIIKFRKWEKYVNTYLGPLWFEHRRPDGRVQSFYKPAGTVTGRLSGTGGVHQIPRDVFIRAVLGAAPGWTFIQADYSQVELRIAAMLADEPTMLRAYATGQDIHMNTAVSITGKLAADIEKEERKRAKGVNFGFIYGMSWHKFVDYAFDSYGVTVTAAEAERYRDRFFETYPRLLPWHEKQRRLARKYNRVVSPIGRVRHLTNIMSSDKEVRSEAERQAINSPVQSFASDMMLFALIKLNAMMDPSEAKVIGTVHDSILFEVRDDVVSEWAPIIKSTMEDVASVERTFHTEVTVPIVADVETGTHWGETTEWKEAA